MDVLPLNIVGLHQHYGAGNVVLDGVDLQIADGQFVALVGMNGAGKTTLIKSMLDFISVERGSIEIYGKPHTDYRSREKLVFLPEHFKPPYYLKGGEFLDMMQALYGRMDGEKTGHYLDQLDLPRTVMGKAVRQYSKGMAQKLGLVACLAAGRPLLVLDEPMSGLDPKSRHQFKRLLREKKAQGATLFFSTHLLADVSELCDQMAILHEGRIRFFGSPAQCMHEFDSPDLEAAYMRCIGYESDLAQ